MVVLNQNTPICPDCKAGMFKVERKGNVYLVCQDCHKTYEVLDYGTADNEIVVSDDILEIHEYRLGQDKDTKESFMSAIGLLASQIMAEDGYFKEEEE